MRLKPFTHTFPPRARPSVPRDVGLPSDNCSRSPHASALSAHSPLCRFAGMMPAPMPHSDRPGLDHLDGSSHVCSLTSVAAHILVGAAIVAFSLRCVRASSLPRLSSCPECVSSRSAAPWHVSTNDHPCCVPSAAVWLIVCAHLDECHVPSPAASIGPCSSHPGGYFGSADWCGGEGARKFEAHDAVCVPRLPAQRRFTECLEDARCVVQRRCAANRGQWEPHLYVCYTASWFHVER